MFAVALGFFCVAWTAYEVGRISQRPARRDCGVRAWDERGRPMRIEEVA